MNRFQWHYLNLNSKITKEAESTNAIYSDVKANFIKVMSVSFDILPFEVSQEQLTFASHPNIGRRFFHATVGILRF